MYKYIVKVSTLVKVETYQNGKKGKLTKKEKLLYYGRNDERILHYTYVDQIYTLKFCDLKKNRYVKDFKNKINILFLCVKIDLNYIFLTKQCRHKQQQLIAN